MPVDRIVIFGILNIMLGLCIYTDYKDHKIYNNVVLPCIFLGFFFNSLFYGVEGFKSCCMSFGISLVFFLIFYLIHMMGAGDVKLVVAASVLTNVFYAFGALIIGTILAAFYGTYVWMKTRNRKMRIPYGIFVGLGFYIYQIGILILS